ncbi:hypothetical protein ACPV5O_16870 [Vibrio maritimus]|uniref:hypothetical protein n=1 Tax=Vibrio maritimus TaxID=990268 RepID=UPI004068E247
MTNIAVSHFPTCTSSLRRQGSTISAHQASTKIPVYTGMTSLAVSHFPTFTSSLRRQGSTISAHQAFNKIPVCTGMTTLCVYRHPANIVIPAQAGIYHQRAPSLNQDSCLHRNDGAARFG